MQTILGANGQIGHELAIELAKNYTTDLRLVSRHPEKVNPTDSVVAADFMSLDDTISATKDSEVVYFTTGLPMNSDLMEKMYPTMVENVVKAAKINQFKLVYLDNTYMLPKTSEIQTESTKFNPVGRKSVVRANAAKTVLEAINSGEITALIARAPEFYGPDRTNSITNNFVFNRILADKKVLIPLSKTTKRSLIWTPDVSKSLAILGKNADTFDQTWNLPTPEPISYQQMLMIAESLTGKKIPFRAIRLWQFKFLSLFNQRAKELLELLPRYAVDNNFSSEKFKRRFPNFQITSYSSGIQTILRPILGNS